MFSHKIGAQSVHFENVKKKCTEFWLNPSKTSSSQNEHLDLY